MDEKIMFRRPSEMQQLLRLSLLSPEEILQLSERILPNGKRVGEVQLGKTIDIKTKLPEDGGLFCQRIFGPVENFSCACGRYKVYDGKGSVTGVLVKDFGSGGGKEPVRTFTRSNLPESCEDCDTDLVHKKVRRYRFGHIKLSSPVSHPWFYAANPAYMPLILGIRRPQVERLTRCQDAITSQFPVVDSASMFGASGGSFHWKPKVVQHVPIPTKRHQQQLRRAVVRRTLNPAAAVAVETPSLAANSAICDAVLNGGFQLCSPFWTAVPQPIPGSYRPDMELARTMQGFDPDGMVGLGEGDGFAMGGQEGGFGMGGEADGLGMGGQGGFGGGLGSQGVQFGEEQLGGNFDNSEFGQGQGGSQDLGGVQGQQGQGFQEFGTQQGTLDGLNLDFGNTGVGGEDDFKIDFEGGQNGSSDGKFDFGQGEDQFE